MTWQITVTDVEDPDRHRAVATQARENLWGVRYYRGDEEISYGHIATPPPCLPPFASMTMTLEQERKALAWHRERGLTDG